MSFFSPFLFLPLLSQMLKKKIRQRWNPPPENVIDSLYEKEGAGFSLTS